MDHPLSPAIARSLQIYRQSPERDQALDLFYAPLVQAGALVFDVGAHVGDRTACFRRLGATVIALEPQDECVHLLQTEMGADENITIVRAAAGAQRGTAILQCNVENPTVSTLSNDFIAAAEGAPGWETQRWTKGHEVDVLTLDDLIERHGLPHFIKIDVEGFELEVLRGLTSSVAHLSFEFTTIQRDLAIACIERLQALGLGFFRSSLGESLTYVQDTAWSADQMSAWIAALPPEANSGDIYASIARDPSEPALQSGG